MEICSFGIAKKLKEKGFKEKVNAYYGKHENIFNVHPALDMNDADYRASAPTISQVLKWLREEKEIDIVIYPIDANTVFMGGEKYILSVYLNKKRDYKLHHDNIDKYRVWELAALAGIEYVLDNLI